MRKILLVLEDYNEMIYIETLLKKMGFDSLGIQNESHLADEMLSFSPHIVVCDYAGRKVNGISLNKKTKRINGFPKFVLIQGQNDQHPQFPLDNSEPCGFLRRPVHPVELVEVLTQILGLDAEPFKAKLKKLGLFQETTAEGIQIVSGKGGKGRPASSDDIESDKETPIASPSLLRSAKKNEISDKERAAHFRRGLEDLPVPTVQTLNRSKALDQAREFRSRENDPEIQNIDDERRRFVRELFRKR